MKKRSTDNRINRVRGGAGVFALLLVLIACLAKADCTDGDDGPLSGNYVVTAVRNASDVAVMADPVSEPDSPIGETIGFAANELSMTGLACDHWEITKPGESVVNIHDPMLQDVNIGPVDSENSAGDQRVMKSYAYACEGQPFMNVLKVDDRVIVIPWGNSSKYLIAEIPLSAGQVTQLQKELKSMKFLDSEATGIIDDATVSALGFWASYRAENPDAYRFKRTALTENLLDGLGVLDAEKD